MRLSLMNRNNIFYLILVFLNFEIALASGVNIKWEAQFGATSYLVEISKENSFRKTLLRIETQSTLYKYHEKNPGRYFYRITPYFYDMLLKDNASVGVLDIRYAAPKVRQDEKIVKWQPVPKTQKYVLKMIDDKDMVKVFELKKPEISRERIKEDSRLEISAYDSKNFPISKTSITQIRTTPRPIKKELKRIDKEILPLQYVAILSGITQNKITSSVVQSRSATGSIFTIEGAYSLGNKYNFGIKGTYSRSQVIDETIFVPELSFLYRIDTLKKKLMYFGFNTKLDRISPVYNNSLIKKSYLYYGSRIYGFLTKKLGYQVDFEHTDGIFQLSQVHLEYFLNKWTLFSKFNLQKKILNHPSSGQSSYYQDRSFLLGVGNSY